MVILGRSSISDSLGLGGGATRRCAEIDLACEEFAVQPNDSYDALRIVLIGDSDPLRGTAH